MNTSRNPYTSMLLTFNPARMYGWENEISSLLQIVTASQPNGHAIYGIRAIGKTTLLKYLMHPNGAMRHYEEYVRAEYQPGGGRRLLFVYLNFHGYDGEHPIFQGMIEALEDQMGREQIEIFAQMLHAYANKQQVVNQLRQYLIELNRDGIRVVFILDDFDVPLEYIADDDDRLLRTLCDDAALIIATEAPIPELRPDLGISSPLLGILRPEAIGLISESAARRLISEPARDANIRFSSEEEDFLIHIAGRQPFLLTTACELYFDMRSEYPDLAALIHENRSRFQTQFLNRLSSLPHVENLLKRLWNRLGDEERRTLHAMSQGMSSSNGSMAARLANKALAYWDIRSGNYCVFSLLFEEFIRRHYHVPTERPTEPVTIPIGGSIPPIDRALLRYFLNHPNQILTFDELLDAVWEDNQKSKRALEAAVHRLRRSLGAGEIMNIRGKGYKFVPENTSISTL